MINFLTECSSASSGAVVRRFQNSQKIHITGGSPLTNFFVRITAYSALKMFKHSLKSALIPDFINSYDYLGPVEQV